MAKKKKRKTIQPHLSPEKYIRTRCRNLPIGECLVNEDWHEDGLAHVFVVREHSNENVTVGVYLVDIYCLGLKDTMFKFNVSTIEYEELVDTLSQEIDFISIDYVLAHNIIYGGIEYAEDYGFSPHSDFNKTTQFILEEDDDDVEYLDLEFGHNGKPLLIVHEDQPYLGHLETLKKTAGVGNFDYILPTDTDLDDGYDEYENYEDDNFLIRYYDDDIEKKVISEFEQAILMREEEADIDSFDNMDFSEETHYRLVEVAFAEVFSDEEKEEAVKFGDNLFDVELIDNFEIEDINFDITDEIDVDIFLDILEMIANDKHKKAIKKLKHLMDTYPDSPIVLFYMILALLSDGKGRKADELVELAYKKHPNNFKIKTQYLSYLLRKKRHEKFVEIVGSNFSLQDLYPETESFLYSDALIYLKIVFKYLLDTNQLLKARVVFSHLDQMGVEDEEMAIYHKLILVKSVEFLENRIMDN